MDLQNEFMNKMLQEVGKIKELFEKAATTHILLLIIITLQVIYLVISVNSKNIDKFPKIKSSSEIKIPHNNKLKSNTINNTKSSSTTTQDLSSVSTDFDEKFEKELIAQYSHLVEDASSSVQPNLLNFNNSSSHHSTQSNSQDLLKKILENQENISERLNVMDDKIVEMSREILFMKKSNVIHNAKVRRNSYHPNSTGPPLAQGSVSPVKRTSILTLDIGSPISPSDPNNTNSTNNMYIWENQKRPITRDLINGSSDSNNNKSLSNPNLHINTSTSTSASASSSSEKKASLSKRLFNLSTETTPHANNYNNQNFSSKRLAFSDDNSTVSHTPSTAAAASTLENDETPRW